MIQRQPQRIRNAKSDTATAKATPPKDEVGFSQKSTSL